MPTIPQGANRRRELGTRSPFPRIINFASVPNDRGEHNDEHALQTAPPVSALGPAIDSELAILASIEARFWDEVGKLERSALPLSVKEHLRLDLEAKRKMAREPHVIRLAELHEAAMMRKVSVRRRHTDQWL
jgi:hypothetical protein